MNDCYSFNKICVPDAGMLPCTPGSSQSAAQMVGTTTATCEPVMWFWVLAGVTGLALIVNNNRRGR